MWSAYRTLSGDKSIEYRNGHIDQTIFIATDGALYRISNAKLDRMMRHPESELVPIFAGQRIRTAELVMELFDSEPFRVCRETFSIFQFDTQGCLDIGRYDMQQNALVNVMLDPVFVCKTSDANVLDATAKGGAWTPTKSLKCQIEKHIAVSPQIRFPPWPVL